MESQPQSPEFRNNPENFCSCSSSMYLSDTLHILMVISYPVSYQKHTRMCSIEANGFTQQCAHQ